MNPVQSKEEMWKEHIKKANHHPGGVWGYCKEAGITSSGFYQWRKKLSGKKEISRPSGSFVPLVIEESRYNVANISKAINKSDAEWVGQMLASFIRGLS